MSAYGYGSRLSTSFSRDLADDAMMEPGKTYHAEFEIQGIRTLLPGWENDVINTVRESVYRENCEITYIDVDSANHSAVVQYKLMETGNATAMVFPVLAVLSIVYIITIVVGIYLISLTLVGTVKEISNVVAENPIMTPIIMGVIAIAVLIYMKRQ